jgi:hypothetical protein
MAILIKVASGAPLCDTHLKSVPGITIHNVQSRKYLRLARYWLTSSILKSVFSCYLSRMQKNMENDENKPVWEKNSRGFWLTVCLMLSAVVGWLMFHWGILH